MLECSSFLVKRLGLLPAKVVWRTGDDTCYEIEEGCIPVSTGTSLFMWPLLIADEVPDGIDNPPNGAGSRA